MQTVAAGGSSRAGRLVPQPLPDGAAGETQDDREQHSIRISGSGGGPVVGAVSPEIIVSGQFRASFFGQLHGAISCGAPLRRIAERYPCSTTYFPIVM